MIVYQDGSFTFMHDMGRPSYFEDADFERWSKYYDFIENSDIEIVVNGVYPQMRKYCDEKQKYGGNGYKFCFWFRSEEDRERFENGIDKIRGYRIDEIDGERLVRYKQYLYDHFPKAIEALASLYRSRTLGFRSPPLT